MFWIVPEHTHVAWPVDAMDPHLAVDSHRIKFIEIIEFYIYEPLLGVFAQAGYRYEVTPICT